MSGGTVPGWVFNEYAARARRTPAPGVADLHHTAQLARPAAPLGSRPKTRLRPQGKVYATLKVAHHSPEKQQAHHRAPSPPVSSRPRPTSTSRTAWPTQTGASPSSTAPSCSPHSCPCTPRPTHCRSRCATSTPTPVHSLCTHCLLTVYSVSTYFLPTVSTYYAQTERTALPEHRHFFSGITPDVRERLQARAARGQLPKHAPKQSRRRRRPPRS